MTCDEFRQANSGGIARILALTRAERSAAAKHWTECYECRDWTNTFNFLMSPKESREVELAKARDRLDPETYRATTEEAEDMRRRFDLDEEPAKKEQPK